MSDCGLLSCAFIERVNRGAKTSETGHGREGNTHPQRLSFPSPERDSPGLFTHRPQTPQRSFQEALVGKHSTPAPKRTHSGTQGETRGVSGGGGITTLGVRCVVRNLCARSGQKSILCHLCMDRGNVGEKQRAFGTETRTVRVSVPRRRGPAGSRRSAAVSCAAPVSFAVRYHCDEGQRGKFVNVTVVILFVV